MQINQPMLQLLLYKKAQNEQAKQQEVSAETTNPPAVTNSAVNATNTTPTSEDYKIADAFAMKTNNRTLSANDIINNERISNTSSVTVSTLSPALISQIKQTIYDLHHRTSTPGSGNGGGNTTPSPSPDPLPNPLPNPLPLPEPTPNPTSNEGKLTGITSNFTSVDEMFTYINVNKDSGLSANKLWQLTQRDNWEENNNHFFGKLNESFNSIDTNGDDILSYDEICTFIGDEMNKTEYNNAINQYSAALQTLFERMTPDEKLQFSIEKAREYLEAIGLTEQLNALNRLEREGKLGFTNLNIGKIYNEGTGGWTLGSYQYWVDVNGDWYGDMDDFQDLNNDGYDDKTGIHSSASEDFYDENGDGKDDYFGGIFLDKYYYTERSSTKWYDLVATLIHELTHATASFHPTDGTIWGEYVAYQTEEDYLDSIGHSQWNGRNEESSITSHINTYYENEPIPGFDWTTYGTYA